MGVSIPCIKSSDAITIIGTISLFELQSIISIFGFSLPFFESTEIELHIVQFTLIIAAFFASELKYFDLSDFFRKLAGICFVGT